VGKSPSKTSNSFALRKVCEAVRPKAIKLLAGKFQTVTLAAYERYLEFRRNGLHGGILSDKKNSADSFGLVFNILSTASFKLAM